MKKCSGAKKAVHDRQALRRGLHTAKRLAKYRKAKLKVFNAAHEIPKKKQPTWKRPVHTIECPSHLNLSSNYDATINLIAKIRSWAISGIRSPLHIDFKTIQTITPAASLLLAAELDRWNQLTPHRKLKAADAHLWDPSVRQLLKQMGFFELLGINEKTLKCEFPIENDKGQHFLPFYAGEDSGGGMAEILRDRIEQFAGRLKDRYSLYDGLVEAMTNVAHHAYPGTHRLKRWWISASLDVSSSKLTVLCLDHGVGIPNTLPRTNKEVVRKLFSGLGGIVKDDAKMIRAATELTRSSTGRKNRGYGLQRDITRYVSKHDSAGRLRIFSNAGMYIFEKDRSGRESINLMNHTHPIFGTFIEWTIEDYATVLI